MSATATVPAFLARFKCLGAECEDTCCKGWGMQVDTSTQALYREKAPELMNFVTGEGEAAIMKRDAKSDFCVKFEGGLCGIQRDHGEKFLGDACYLYPRSTRTLGTEVTMTAALSCPEIVRLSLFSDEGFADTRMEAERLPLKMQDYLPEGLTAEQAMNIHRAFLNAALVPDVPAEQSFLRIFTAVQSLSRITISSWPDAVPFYLAHADTAMQPAEPRLSDSAFLLQALCGLVKAAKYAHHTRLMQTISDMEKALHVTIRWDTLAIAAMPDCGHALERLQARWKSEWKANFAEVLKRYLAMQVSLALFPFSGFGHTMNERAAVIGVRFATVRLALMSICAAAGGAPKQSDIIRVVQSLSRFLDHLAGADFSLQIYAETGWLTGPRLRGMLEEA